MTRREILKSGLRAGLLALMAGVVARGLRSVAMSPAQDGVRQDCDVPGACARCRLAARCQRRRAAGRGG
ncbi:MAG: hypothetical protein ACOX9E_04615 [Lentisphaeria bacterium]|jgi:hypothetical protein